MTRPSPSLQREAAAIAAFMVIGAILRFWGEASLGLNHFDEGVFATSAYTMLSPKGIAGINPLDRYFGPPGFPILVSYSYLLFGISDVAAILVSQVAGILTIPALGWVGRRTFGPGAGAMAAGLLAMAGPSVVFSRMALTDTTFLLAWIIAIGLGTMFLERPGILRAILFGAAVGLAQNVKYNGYLPGFTIALAAIAGCLWPAADGRRHAGFALARGLIAAVAAAVVYWPWFHYVDHQPGGYADLLRHHRTYLTGWGSWLTNWRLQMSQATALSGSIYGQVNWGMIAWPLSLLGGVYAASGRKPSAMEYGAILAGAILFGTSPNAPWWITLFSLPWLLTDHRQSVRVVGFWWTIMAILTPFYHPYARLCLPMHAAAWVVLGSFAPAIGTVARIPVSPRTIAIALAIGVAMIQDLAIPPRAHPLPGLLASTDSLRMACERLDRTRELAVQSGAGPMRIRVLGRPSAVYYLGLFGTGRIYREIDLVGLSENIQPGDWAVLDDTILPGFEAGKAFDPRWRRAMSPVLIPDGMSLPTLLDINPNQAYEWSPSRDSYLHVYEPNR